MKTVFLELLRREHPSSVASVTTATYRDLSQVRAVFFKDEVCYVAESFYTATWIAPTPAGPACDNGERCKTIHLDRLDSVADIYTLTDPKEIRTLEALSSDNLKCVYDFLDIGSRMLMERVFGNNSSLLHSVSFSFIPEPLILCTIKCPWMMPDDVVKAASNVVFSIAIDMQWQMTLVSQTYGLQKIVPDIYAMVADYLRHHSEGSVYKEITGG